MQEDAINGIHIYICEISLELTSGFQMLALAMPHYEVLGGSRQLCLFIHL